MNDVKQQRSIYGVAARTTAWFRYCSSLSASVVVAEAQKYQVPVASPLMDADNAKGFCTVASKAGVRSYWVLLP